MGSLDTVAKLHDNVQTRDTRICMLEEQLTMSNDERVKDLQEKLDKAEEKAAALPAREQRILELEQLLAEKDAVPSADVDKQRQEASSENNEGKPSCDSEPYDPCAGSE